MVFLDDKLNVPCDFVYLDRYTPYRVFGQRNPNFTAFSGKILDIKEGQPQAVLYFRNEIDKIVGTGFVIVLVPPSNPEGSKSGMPELVRLLTAKNGRINGADILVRHKAIQKLAHGGNRDKQVHLNSIRVDDPDGTLRGAKV